MTKAPIDFVWSSLPVPALLIDPYDIITETNPAAEGFFNNSGTTGQESSFLLTLDI